MLHAKSESDGSTSSTPKSTTSHNQPLYYVISPPHDFSPPQTSPLFSSPINSPLHPSRPSNSSNTSSRVHSHSSYSSRVSGFGRRYWSRKRGWNECNVIKEEEDFDILYCDYRRCKCLIAVLGLASVFSLFCLIIWGASRPYHPQVSLKSLTVYNFYSGEGSDFSGVPTKMLTINCSLNMSITNPATFFGIHVHSTTVNLIFSQITVATGLLQRKYLPRTSQRTVHVNMKGEMIPLYGAGASLPVMSNKPDRVPVKLHMEVISNGNVVGKLVKTKHLQHITCYLVITNSKNIEVIMFKEELCMHN
ncbi:hypothetical protein DCAR_0728369 [Daucus carota subsp. sativus]|uniref:Late embryogenesis abundant protein LEA-2 subgroup domain-containing protein n=1 Tax=Daucus carota subsp. sativus TaxID=79200 RepID=A0AAF1B8S0_DAUCS|nr:hypothetical protein DCAR_0728369 [Daucus carota subsp. sativus]